MQPLLLAPLCRRFHTALPAFAPRPLPVAIAVARHRCRRRCRAGRRPCALVYCCRAPSRSQPPLPTRMMTKKRGLARVALCAVGLGQARERMGAAVVAEAARSWHA